jgi:hypothetical protein
MLHQKTPFHFIKISLVLGLLTTTSAFANLDARDTETDCKFSLLKITPETLNTWQQQRDREPENRSISFQAINQCTGKTETLSLVGKGIQQLPNGEIQLEALYAKTNQSQSLRRLNILPHHP